MGFALDMGLPGPCDCAREPVWWGTLGRGRGGASERMGIAVQQTYLSFHIVSLAQWAPALCPQPNIGPGIAYQQRQPSRQDCCKHIGCNSPSCQFVPYELPDSLWSAVWLIMAESALMAGGLLQHTGHRVHDCTVTATKVFRLCRVMCM